MFSFHVKFEVDWFVSNIVVPSVDVNLICDTFFPSAIFVLGLSIIPKSTFCTLYDVFSSFKYSISIAILAVFAVIYVFSANVSNKSELFVLVAFSTFAISYL